MAKSKLLRIGWIMILIIGLALIVTGVLHCSQGTLMPYHEKFIGMTQSEIRDFNPELMVFVAFLLSYLLPRIRNK